MSLRAPARPATSPWFLRALGGVLFLSLSTGAAEPDKGTITVKLTGFDSDKGVAMLALFDDADAFPTKAERARKTLRVPIANKQVVTAFQAVPHGTYAISVFHDENGNGQLDSNFLGIPKEPLGSSNNAKGRMGPPKWQDAKFPLSGPTATQNIQIRRL